MLRLSIALAVGLGFGAFARVSSSIVGFKRLKGAEDSYHLFNLWMPKLCFLTDFCANLWPLLSCMVMRSLVAVWPVL